MMELFTKPNAYEDCVLKDSAVCKAMNNPPCPACEIGKLSAERQEEIRSDYELVLELLPEGGVAPFYESETCLLCRNEPKGKREYYAIADFAHVKPQRTKSSVIGVKVKTRIGSLIPVQIASCSRCRMNILMAEYMMWVILVLAGIIGLCVLGITPLHEALIGVNELLPLGIFLAFMALTLIFGRMATNAYIKARSAMTIMNVDELERIAALREKGWFSLSDDKKSVRLLFSKKPLRRGWFTPGASTQEKMKSV